MIEWVLFDNDGTLVDSEILCNQAIVELFAGQAVTLDAHTLTRHYRGGKMSEILATLAREHQISLPPAFMDDYRQRVAQLFEQHLQPVSGIPELLDALQVNMAVVSNGPLAKIRQALLLCGLAHHFDNRLYSAFELNQHKPDPALYLTAMADLNICAHQCVAIEDSPSGVASATGAGITTLFYNQYNETLNNDKVIPFTSMQQVPDILARLNAQSR